MENIESAENPIPKYENLSEEQKELLSGQFGIEDAETFDAIINGELSIEEGDQPFTAEEMRNYIKQMLENEK